MNAIRLSVVLFFVSCNTTREAQPTDRIYAHESPEGYTTIILKTDNTYSYSERRGLVNIKSAGNYTVMKDTVYLNADEAPPLTLHYENFSKEPMLVKRSALYHNDKKFKKITQRELSQYEFR